MFDYIDNHTYDNIVVSPSGRLTAGSSRTSETTFVWESQTRNIISKIGAEEAITFISSPHGNEDYIVLIMEKSLVVWDHSHGTCIAILAKRSDFYIDNNVYPETRLQAFVGKNFLVIADRKGPGAIFAWDKRTFDILHIYYRPRDPQESKSYEDYRDFICVSPSEKWLLAYTNSHSTYEVCVWNTATWTLYAALAHHKDHAAHFRVAAAFSDDDSFIAAVCHCGVAQIWDFHTAIILHNTDLVDTTGNTARKLDWHSTHISSNGRLVCWISAHNVVNLSDVGTGALLWSSPHAYFGHISDISLSLDGQYVAACYGDNQFRVWRMLDGECIANERGGGDLKFSQNGDVLLVGGWGSMLNTFHIRKL